MKEEEEEATIVMTRTFDAPRDLVWSAFTDPKHVSRWFGGRGFETPLCEVDVRPGGLWKHVMVMPGGGEMVMEVVFLEVKKPERLVWQHVDHGKRPNSPHPTSHMTVTLEAVAPKKTKWTLVTRFDSIAERDAANRIGFADVISQGTEKLAELLATDG